MSSAPSDRDPAFWQRKLAAFLHDPPEKAYDFGPAHQKRAEAHAASFGVAEVWRSLVHQPDWTAAAADRFVFPHGSAAGVGGLGESGPSFVHPLSGRAADGGASLRPEHFPGRPEAEKWLADIRPEWRARDPEAAFYQAWRVWPAHAAEHAGGERQGAVWLPYLPADTRVPDASIWHHCAVVSALQAARKTPAFLLFQVGPVQDFISQARSVRDLWSGSYLLSWLVITFFGAGA